VVLGVVAFVVMLVFTGVLTRPEPLPPSAPIIDTRREDLLVFTRMLDTVALEPELLSGTDSALQHQLHIAESLVNTGSSRDAFQKLEKTIAKAGPAARASLLAAAGLLRHRLRDYPQALLAFRQALAAHDSAWPAAQQTDSAPAMLAARLCFNIAYLFQQFSQPESARRYYQQSLALLSATDSLPWLRFLPALFNNYGVAQELLGDTAAALELYFRAATLLDTLMPTRDAQRLRENRHRLASAGNR
jgi:tetratricopeptide (TPR) repeat protein